MKKDFSDFILSQLVELKSILEYWETNTQDFAHEGFVGRIDSKGVVEAQASKGAVLNARILWTFSAAFNFSKEEKHLKMAERAFNYFVKHFVDAENGGVYWELDYTGKPLNTRKQTYAQGFAVYGLSEYYRASGNAESLELAQKLYFDMEKHCFDSQFGGYVEALDRTWNPMDDMRLSDKDANEPKSMNTHLHVLEPYTNLYRVWKDERLAESIRKLIRVFLDRIIDTQTAHFNLFFDMDWTVKSHAVSYGHDIEGAWLLTEAAEELGDKDLLHEVERMAIRMTDATLAEGSDADGSIFNEREGNHLDTDKHWWPQAEAMVGYVNAWQITKNELYLNEALRVWKFIDSHIIDKKLGEWFWRVDAQGNTYETDDKTGFWKCPYHNSRALIEVINRLRKNNL